jgi:hypothetical protein
MYEEPTSRNLSRELAQAAWETRGSVMFVVGIAFGLFLSGWAISAAGTSLRLCGNDQHVLAPANDDDQTHDRITGIADRIGCPAGEASVLHPELYPDTNCQRNEERDYQRDHHRQNLVNEVPHSIDQYRMRVLVRSHLLPISFLENFE